ncbi:MAG TPA: PH domain-containing protein [Acidimicrobiales bacterium]|nr:PH domain-containing protein [Acidimicrobiales bacterium]
MSYPSKLLNPNESVVVELNPHWSVLVRPMGVALVVAGTAAGLLFEFPSMPLWAALVLGVVIAVPVFWLGLRWLQRSTTVLVVTTDRVALRTGLMVKKGWDARLERINDVSFEQSLMERIFGVGDLWIDTGGEDGTKGMAHTPHPDGVKALIFERQDAHRTAGAETAPLARNAPVQVSAGLSVAEQLEKLDDLRRRGVISDDEFDAEKSRLIGI